jgi:transketolase
VEQLANLRAIPNALVIRPADANETAFAWRVAIEARGGPVLLALTRQEVPTLDRAMLAPADGLRQGAYVLDDGGAETPQLILIGTGSEVALVLQAAAVLRGEGIAVRCVSMPCWELFEALPPEHRERVLPAAVRARVAVELGVAQGWHRWVGDAGAVVSVERFGASAPAKTLLREYGFTVEAVCAKAREVLAALKRS